MKRGERAGTRGRRTRRGRNPHARPVPGAAGPRAVGVVAVLAALGLVAGWTVTENHVPDVLISSQQDPGEAIMVAAGQWALDRLPPGDTRLDPHRSGAGKDADRVQRVARSLGASLAPLDDTRQCADSIDPSTCQLSAARVLAITAPRIDGDRAQVKVYAWYRSDSAREPVAQRSWDLQLRRNGQSWRVVSGG